MSKENCPHGTGVTFKGCVFCALDAEKKAREEAERERDEGNEFQYQCAETWRKACDKAEARAEALEKALAKERKRAEYAAVMAYDAGRRDAESRAEAAEKALAEEREAHESAMETRGRSGSGGLRILKSKPPDSARRTKN